MNQRWVTGQLDFNNQCKYWKWWKWLCITKSTVPIRYYRNVLTYKWHSLYGWHSARKKYSSALAMGLRLFYINPSTSSLAWVWWVITREYGEYSSLLCENVVLINMTDRDQSRYAPSQWETSSQCKDVSYGLGAYLDWSIGSWRWDIIVVKLGSKNGSVARFVSSRWSFE